MSVLSLLGGQKNMQKQPGLFSRLNQVHELPFFKVGSFIYLEHSIDHLKDILLY